MERRPAIVNRDDLHSETTGGPDRFAQGAVATAKDPGAAVYMDENTVSPAFIDLLGRDNISSDTGDVPNFISHLIELGSLTPQLFARCIEKRLEF